MPAKKITKPNIAAKVTKPKPVATKTVTSKSIVTQSKPAIERALRPERTDVFVSYSHADKKWLADMQIHLKPLGREHGITIWDDTRIQSGDKWKAEIVKALSRSRVAILLVSARFMGSNFIATDELPPLLQAAEKEGLQILSVIVGRTGAFNAHPISTYQAVNDPALPLNLMSEGQVDEVFSQLYSRIHDVFVGPTLKATRGQRVKQSQPVAKKDPVTKKEAAPERSTTTKKAYTSKNKAVSDANSSSALLVKRTGEWLVVSTVQGNVGETIHLELRLTTTAQRAFVSSLRQNDNLGSIVFRSQTYLCRTQDVQMITTGAREVWHLKATLQPISRRADVTYGITKPEKQAELNARFLLLDEIPSGEQSSFGYYSNHSQINGGKSPLPLLYQQLNKQGTTFKQTANLIITWFLQTNAIVDHIHKLVFSLKADILNVRFEGERNSQYQNEAPVIIKVEGACDLSKSISDKVLRLGPLSRY